MHLERNKESLLLLLLPGLSLQADTVPSTAADEDEDSRFPEEAAPLLVASLLAALPACRPFPVDSLRGDLSLGGRSSRDLSLGGLSSRDCPPPPPPPPLPGDPAPSSSCVWEPGRWPRRRGRGRKGGLRRWLPVWPPRSRSGPTAVSPSLSSPWRLARSPPAEFRGMPRGRRK